VTTTTSKSGALGETSTFKPYVTVTSVLKPKSENQLPFTGSGSTPLVVLGIVLLATGLTLTLSQARRRERSRA
jgi:LPXTG-motif cell wall-anchored protein